MNIAKDSTFGDPIESTTTNPNESADQTTGSGMTSSSSRDGGFYFRCAVLVIGFVGAAINALVLYAMVVSRQHRKQVLIFNQNLLDLVSCLFLGAKYSANLGNIDLNGTLGYCLCLTLLGEGCSWGPFVGSLINLAAISIERYLKVLHPAWAKKNLRRRLIYSSAAFAWVGGISVAAGVTIHTAVVVDGECYTLIFFSSKTAQMAYGIWYFSSFYVTILLIFIFCYGRILLAIHRQTKVMAAHGTSGSGGVQSQSHKIKTNLTKTMILVCLLFAVTWTPANVYALLLNIDFKLRLRENGYYTIIVVGYLYSCINPFIYATKFEPVKRVLLGLIPFKTNRQPLGSVDIRLVRVDLTENVVADVVINGDIKENDEIRVSSSAWPTWT